MKPTAKPRRREAPMVVLNRIYTRTGDDGTTSLGSGARRKKYDLRVAAYGTLDEVNAVIGAGAAAHRRRRRASTRRSAASRTTCSTSRPTLLPVGKGPGRRAADRHRRAGRLARRRDRPAQRGAGAAASRSSCRAAARPRRYLHLARTDLPARRAHHGRAGGPAGRGASRSRRSNTSTGCRIICSSPAATPTTRARRDVLWAPGQNR